MSPRKSQQKQYIPKIEEKSEIWERSPDKNNMSNVYELDRSTEQFPNIVNINKVRSNGPAISIRQN